MGFCGNHDWWWWRLVILEFYASYKDHSGFITINTLLYLSQIFILSRQFSRWKGSLILLWNQRRRRKRRNQEKDKTSKEFYAHVEIIQMKSDNNTFLKNFIIFCLLLGWRTTTFRPLPRRVLHSLHHSLHFNHCILWFGFRPVGH